MGKAGTLRIPRATRVSKRAYWTGKKHGPNLMAMYGPDGRLLFVFDSSRCVDIYIDDEDGRFVTQADLDKGRLESFDWDEADGLTYFIGADIGPIKIGRSANVEARLKNIQAYSPLRLSVLATRPGADREKMYHELFSAHRLHGEWFERAPEILAEIDRLNGPRSSARSNEGLPHERIGVR